MATLSSNPLVLPPLDTSSWQPIARKNYLANPKLPPHNSPFISASGGGIGYGFATCSKTGESVKIDVDLNIDCFCSHTLQKSCEEFVDRCKGRGLTGRDVAVVDMMDEVCDRLMPIEEVAHWYRCPVGPVCYG